MAHGGIRPKAGRPKGVKNNSKILLESRVKDAIALLGEGLSPVEYMLHVMRDESVETSLRLDAARSASPYIHKRQPQALEVDGTLRLPTSIVYTSPMLPDEETDGQRALPPD